MNEKEHDDFLNAAEFWSAELARALKRVRKLTNANADCISVANAYGPIFGAIQGLKQLVEDEEE